MAIKESDIKGLLKSITSIAMKSVQAGQRQVIAPTVLRKMAADIITQSESGSIKNFETAINKVEIIIDKLGLKLEDFNTNLANRIKDLREQKDKSAKEVEMLRERNIVAETKTIKDEQGFRYETHVLSKQEIKERTSLLKQNTKRVDDIEKALLSKREKLLKQEMNESERSEIILKDEERLAKLREKLEKEEKTLNPLKEDDGGPQGSRAVTSFYETLKEPFKAVGDAFLSIRDGVMDAVGVFNYFAKGGFMKTLKNLGNSLKSFGKMLMMPKILITAAIIGLIAVIWKFKDNIIKVGQFIIGIPGMIWDGIKKVWTMITDTFKKMINGVIKLMNKIPGVNIELLETSDMKKEKEEKAKKKRIKESTDEGEMAAAVTQTNVSDFDDDTAKTQKAKGYEDGLATDSIYYGDVAKGGNLGIKSPADKRKEKLEKFDEEAYIKASEEKYGSSIAPFELRDREKFKFMRTGKVTDPNELKEAQLENDKLKQSAPPVIVTNANKSTNISSSGTSVTGFMSNKNVDDTFINLNTVSV